MHIVAYGFVGEKWIPLFGGEDEMGPDLCKRL
jgi:hypothetical protein